MNVLSLLTKCCRWALLPLRTHATFFIMLYALGVVCAWLTLPPAKGAELYEYLYLELFFDLYLLCAFLMLFPRRLARWIKGVLYVLFYATTLMDVYCFNKFQSSITPSILLLISETDSREAVEFLKSYLNFDILFSKVGVILLLMVLHIAFAFNRRYRKWLRLHYVQQVATCREWIEKHAQHWQAGIGAVAMALMVWGGISTIPNKQLFVRLMSGQTIGEVEHLLTAPERPVLYHPLYRLTFSLYANSLAAQQVKTLIQASKTVKVDSCHFVSKHIVLIIGESFGRHHSQQYGYFMPTTPRQVKRERSGFLVKYNDVVSPWNLTSFVFKHLFSMYSVGDKGEWSDYPLFPQLFRKAGYHVNFITNQFLPKTKEEVYDFSGGFFLNNPELSESQFDTRNDKVHYYDEGLLEEYEKLKSENKEYNLTIFHLIGQHVNYRQRSPKDRKRFKADDYDTFRPKLNKKQKRVLADYDNAVLYNDSVVDAIVKRFEKEETIVIYVPDHGEECYEEDRGFICRNHSSEIDYKLAKYEFEIPFWIWCSRQYVRKHPEIFKAVIQAKNRRLMTDALPHMLLYLAGIHAKDYNPRHNVLSEEYDEQRPRLLKGKVNYDGLTPPDSPQGEENPAREKK